MHIQNILILLMVYLTAVNGLKVAFLIPGCSSDLGWNYNILQAILKVQKDYASAGVTVVYQESVTTATCETAAADQVTAGADMVVFPTGSFETCAKNIAAANPTKKFVVQNSGTVYSELPNLAVDVKGGVFHARFVVGVLAGKQNNINKVCFMAPKTYGSLKRWANAIFLGMRNQSSYSGELIIGLTNDFDHPPSERKVFDYFDSIDCDLIIPHQNSLYVHLLAANNNRFSIGWGLDMAQFAGDSVLVSIVTDWTDSFAFYINKLIAGTFTNERFDESLTNGALSLSHYSKNVKHPAKDDAEDMYDRLKVANANPFCGPPVLMQYGTVCTDESNLIATYLPGISVVYDGTV